MSDANDSPETKHLKALGRQKATELVAVPPHGKNGGIATGLLGKVTFPMLIAAIGALAGAWYRLAELERQVEKQWELREKHEDAFDNLKERVIKLEARSP